MGYVRKPNTVCAVCDKPVYKRPKQISSGKVFCSQACYGKSCSIFVKCKVCDAQFLSRLNKKTCSKECSNKLRTGSKYKTGKPTKDTVKTIKLLKRRLIALRGPFCEKCKDNRVSILNVHHKIRRADGGSNELTNLELICPSCHAEEHYGKKIVYDNIKCYSVTKEHLIDIIIKANDILVGDGKNKIESAVKILQEIIKDIDQFSN